MNDQPTPSAVFQFAHDVVDRMAERDPIFATAAGVAGYDQLLPDFSPRQGQANRRALTEDLATVEELSVTCEVDRVAKAYLRERLTIALELEESNEQARTFSVLYSPVSKIRQVFELMSLTSPEDGERVRARLADVRAALDSWKETVLDVAEHGQLPARRHVLGVAEQAETTSRGAYVEYVERVGTATSLDVATSGLAAAAEDAQAANADLATWLREVIAPRAGEHESCGAERYRRWTNYWTGATLNFDELYAWGYQDLRRIRTRMWELAAQLAPEATTLVDVAEALNRDPRRAIEGTDELLRRLKAFTARTVEELDGVHFDIDERIRFCDARLAPSGSAGAPYYIGPTEDLSRPGTTWYPTLGATTFHWWSLASIWYHESVPGHHLQVATATLCVDRQTRFHRLTETPSGYSEGWALYAERLMEELGYFADPGDELGYLCGQALRAARVVVDLGLHLELDAPSDLGELGELGDVGGKRWTPDMAVALLEEWALQGHAMSVSEVNRYLGLPGQAISYKVGERAWLEARAGAKDRLGVRFDLKSFHAHALTTGPLGIDTFREEMARWDGTADAT